MRHDCVLAAQLESLSEGNDGAGVEESDKDEETRIAVIADIARHRRNRKGKTFFTAEDAKGAEEIGRKQLTADLRG